MTVHISGGAGPMEAAAITAVVAALLEEERRGRAAPPVPLEQSPWVLAWRPREVTAPTSRRGRDVVPWTEREVHSMADEIEPR